MAALAWVRPGRACTARPRALTTAPPRWSTRRFLKDFIRNPQARSIKGFPPVMPKIELTDDELAALVAYIQAQGSPPADKAQ